MIRFPRLMLAFGLFVSALFPCSVSFAIEFPDSSSSHNSGFEFASFQFGDADVEEAWKSWSMGHHAAANEDGDLWLDHDSGMGLHLAASGGAAGSVGLLTHRLLMSLSFEANWQAALSIVLKHSGSHLPPDCLPDPTDTSTVPEPSSWLCWIALGVAGLWYRSRRRVATA